MRGLAVVLAALSGAWTLFLFVSGGRDFTLSGLTLTAHNPRRPVPAGFSLEELFLAHYGDSGA